jgi:PAS domain S-box-containing protein
MIQNQEPANLIIIAEDSLTQAERLRITLKRFGYEVAHVINGREALALIRKRRPLMVITDILMPQMDGYELCQCIKTDEKIWDIPVILLTSLSETGDVIKGLECGADSYIMKPFQEQYLLSRINQVLTNKHLLMREKPGKRLDIYFAGRNYKINSNPLQILNLLLSTYESAVQRNLELAENEKELILMNLSLQQKVEERKKELQTQLIQKIEAEKILKKSEEKYRELVDNSLAGVFISDIQGNILFSNDALVSMLNYQSPENLLAVNIRKLFKFPDDLDILTGKLKKEGKVNEFEAEFLLKTGETKHVIISSSIEDEKLSGIILDNTDRILAAERISKYQKELIQSKEKAERSEKLKTAFLTNMSNEILTPMNTLIGFAELLSNPDLSIQKLTEYTNQITESGNYLINLIDNIIDIAKIESGEVRINLSECKINQILLELYDIYDRKRREKEQEKIHLNLRRENKNKDFAIISEPYRLKQIIGNLLSNALKFTESGSIEFGYNIINKPDETGQHFIQFFVKDTGRGIPQEKLDLIFDRFRSDGDSYTKPFEGAGLGLPVSKAYVELLGGRMWYKSVINKGSEFNFTIPYKPVGITSEYENMVKISTDNANWKDSIFLIAEDVESNYQYLELILKETKARLIWAKNGKEAVEKFYENPNIDLILMDLRMPIMSGYEAISEIRKLDKKIPIIIQTAFSQIDDIQKIRETESNDFIIKPINKENLIKTILKYIKNRN